MMGKLAARRASITLVFVSLVVPASAAAAGPVPLDLKTPGAALGINAGGQVVGWGSDVHVSAGWLTKQGVGTTPLPGWPNAINDNAMVVGNTAFDSGAYVWTPANGPVRLGTLAGIPYRYTYAADVNNRSEIVGHTFDRSSNSTLYPHTRAVKWTPEGFMVDLGTLPNTTLARATAINDNGDVVGIGATQERKEPLTDRAFLWTQAKGIIDIGMLPGMSHSDAYDINDSGQVVGSSGTDDPAVFRAFVWTQAGGMADLGTLPGKSTAYAFGINDQGQVVGASGGQPFVWSQATGMQELDLLPGDTRGRADKINDQGQIIGSSGTATTSHAVLWGGDTTKPAATIKAVRGVKLADVRSRGLRLRLTVSEPGSTALTLTRGKTKLATKTVNVTTAGTIAVTFKLSHNARVDLRRPSKATFIVNTAVRDLVGNSDVTATKVTIKR